MVLGKRRRQRQDEPWIVTDQVPDAGASMSAGGPNNSWTRAASTATSTGAAGRSVTTTLAAGAVLPDAADRLLRGNRLRPRHRLAVRTAAR